jgi:Uma2 family endonuclease
VFEVLSTSTSRIDRIEQLREYQATPSIQRYVILEQDSIAATIYLKQDGAWTVSVLTGADLLTMPEIEAEIPLAEVYAEVDLPLADAAEA